MSTGGETEKAETASARGVTDGLQTGDIRRIAPHLGRGAIIGTIIGALPDVGSTLAATLSYTLGNKRYEKARKKGDPHFGQGTPEGIAAIEAANSAVSGANLIPVLSFGIPCNAAAVFLILAADSIGGFNPGPAVFKFTAPGINPELVTAFGIFTLMSIGMDNRWQVYALHGHSCSGPGADPFAGRAATDPYGDLRAGGEHVRPVDHLRFRHPRLPFPP
ncbi:tripartite tricarboxylate transporter permease [Heliomarina baculiformis]|uniref:tripartite tricarboxylate transporter permease n=1 Tax=Heliomarina baculiformis TaxID=2872036 RepID=UPI00235256D2|nr:tripartite tricarboxylate transporter permease [Heliomarina baculiformis]